MASSNLKERDVVQWLENKLGTSSASSSSHSGLGQTAEMNGLWGSRHVCPSVNQELLTEIPSCFVDLQTSTKLKLLLSFLHLSKRNIDQWRDEVEEILSLANQDTDEWVQTVTELLKELPTTGGLSLTMNNEDSHFTKTLTALKKILKKQSKDVCQILPLDAAYVNKNALQLIWGTNAQPSKHFALKRKTKAAAQRVELLQKALDATQMKKAGRSCSTMVPIKDRNMVRKMETNGPLPKIPTQNMKPLSSGFNNCSKIYNRPTSLSKKEGGVKLIDITETPEMLRKKRKEMELEEKAAKKLAKEETKRLKLEEKERKKSRLSESVDEETLVEEENDSAPSVAAASVQPTPSYAADLLEATLPGLPTTDEVAKVQPPSASSLKPVGITATPHFTPLPISQVPTPSAEITVSNNNAATANRASVIIDTKVSTTSNVTTSTSTSNANFQPPSLYSNFAAAFMQQQLPTSVRQTIPQTIPIVRKALPPQGVEQAQPQSVQMLRINLTGQQQAVILQNPNLQSIPPTQNKAVFIVGQSGLVPTTASPTMTMNNQQRNNNDFKSTAPPVGIYASKISIPPQNQPGVLPVNSFLTSNIGAKPTTFTTTIPQPSTNPPISMTATVNAPTQTQFILTKEIMCQAQEMFRTANKLSRPEKALILGFMAGNRENPCPQMGNILTVRLEENQENQTQQDGTSRPVVVETFFQMNYENGEWKKIRKTRPLMVGET